MMYLSQNLKRLRKEKDYTQEDVAEMLGVSAQSVSKWERSETLPDITLLPALSNLYGVSIDSIIGMPQINDDNTKREIFTLAHRHMRQGDFAAAVAVYTEALKQYPRDEGILSDLAMALAIGGDENDLAKAAALCESVLSDNGRGKVCHTTRAALCFIHLKAGEREKAREVAASLPHIRESRETILSQMEKDMSPEEIDASLTFIAIGEEREQSSMEIDFGLDMVAICTEHKLIEKINALREELGSPGTNSGYLILPKIHVRDNAAIAPRRVRARYYADYLVDKEYDNPANAVEDLLAALRKIADMRRA